MAPMTFTQSRVCTQHLIQYGLHHGRAAGSRTSLRSWPTLCHTRSSTNFSRANPPEVGNKRNQNLTPTTAFANHTRQFSTLGRHGSGATIAPKQSSLNNTTNSLEDPPPYQPPTSGILSYLPSSIVPYAELIRLDKPVGTYYLFFPCMFGTLLAAPLATPIAAPLAVAGYTSLFFTGALVMRGAGCTINDLWDRNLDPHVARTRLRPIARGAVKPESAIIFTGAQLLVGLSVLLQFPTECLYYGIPSLALVATYPLAKRVTNYPQAVLGLTFSWGAFMGFPALGVDLLSNQTALTAAACLYTSNIAWTILYDMIYAHMDIKDDAKAGIKSIALRHEKETKAVLSGLAVVQIGLLAAAGVATGAGPLFFAGSCGVGALSLATMIYKVNLKSVSNCWWWFRNGCWITGGCIAGGLLGDYIIRLNNPDDENESESPLQGM